MTTGTLDAPPSSVCVICGSRNVAGAGQCPDCFAPLALTRDGLTTPREPTFVTVLGDSNVGKTVYLGFLLDMLSQRAGDFEAIPVGPYSVDVQQNVISHMAYRVFPPKTPTEADQWNWAYYQIAQGRGKRRKVVDLVMPDLAGEALAAEVAAPETFRIIRRLIDRSAGMLLLLDAALAAQGSSQPDFCGLKALTYIDAARTAGRSRRVQTPIAVVLCKSDLCPECYDNPRRFAQANLTRLWNLCESRFANVAFFACGVVGSLGYAAGGEDEPVVPIPLHTALQGVLEPFQWVMDRVQ